ncbi:epidermal growth factor receptor substrate 15-like 1 isoform X1 [Branchiostoma floridae]|uniref:Epidermal growth factor receptor substrate 15-like 1 isoform X1 n=1 Tax=Branchiostoma floridae TaxID=7739 RepID=A0A9J7L012_BRAFL|nr:epidermal growth factor receptor substrate 15-like 1 isoform X1 [Branchiostoma floridae]
MASGEAAFEGIYRQLDPWGHGKVDAGEAAAFLKRSGLRESVLHKIWNLADQEGAGYLDKKGFIVALQLVSLAQHGQDVSVENLSSSIPPPTMTENVPGSSRAAWAIKTEEKLKFDTIFETLDPVNGILTGDKVRPVLLNSKLPVEILGTVWDLSDIDQDGCLDKEEFAVAMHLVYRALDKQPVPTTLPPELIPPSKRGPSPGLAPGPTPALTSPAHALHSQPAPWVVTPGDKMKYDNIFRQADLDKDGFVSGGEVKDVFMQSGVPQNVLAHIWTLCDEKQAGLLNTEQFALAMWLIQQQVKGIDPPQQLSPEMIPPSSRQAKSAGADVTTIAKEMDVIGREIQDLTREQESLQSEITDKQQQILDINSLLMNLEVEANQSQTTLQQLEKQKADTLLPVQKLDKQEAEVERLLEEVKRQCQEETQLVSRLRSQLTSQESSVQNQEQQLNKARVELNNLRSEEANLEQKLETGKIRLEATITAIRAAHTEIAQVREQLSKLQDTQRNLSTQVGPGGVGDIGLMTATTTSSSWDTGASDPFGSKDPFATTGNGSKDIFATTGNDYNDPFKAEDPFKTDVFQSSVADPGFSTDPFGDDPFSGKDPFGADTGNIKPFEAEPEPVPSLPPKKNPPPRPAPPRPAPPPVTTAAPAEMDPFGSSQSASLDNDPFASSQSATMDNDPFASSQSATTEKDPFSSSQSDPFNFGATDDPFFSGAKSSSDTLVNDPFSSGGDPFQSSGNTQSSAGDFFADFSGFGKVTEEDQLAWARSESEAEQKRLEQLQKQEQADMELAMALSREDSKNGTP